MADLPPIIVFHDDHEECEKQLRAAQATVQTLTSVVEQAEQHVEERDQRVNELAADLLETRAQRARLATELARLSKGFDEIDRQALTQALNEAQATILRQAEGHRDEVARLNATIVRLSGAIREQPGDLRVALTDEQVDAARALLALVHYDDLAASWLDLLPPALGGPFRGRS